MDLNDLVRRSRIGAGLSQSALARRASTSQPAIARYESGATTPSLPTLQRLLKACGLGLEAIGEVGRARRMSSAKGRHRDRVARSKRELLKAARQHGVRRVRLFGSTARETDTSSSDIDLLIDLEPGRTLLDLVGFQQAAAEILGVPVDVATPEILKPRVRLRALRDARPL